MTRLKSAFRSYGSTTRVLRIRNGNFILTCTVYNRSYYTVEREYKEDYRPSSFHIGNVRACMRACVCVCVFGIRENHKKS